MSKTYRLSFAAVMAVLFAFHPGMAAADDEYTKAELVTDIATGVLPLTTFAIAYLKDDVEGQKQFLRSTGVALVLGTTLRVAFNETSLGERPNGNQYGFPSGHIIFVTSSAAYLQDRYGWQYGLPAYAVAGYIAYVRVDTDHHRWRDVIAGAGFSMLISKFFVTPESATHIAPIIGPEWFGFRLERSF